MTGDNAPACDCGPELERQALRVQELELERDAYLALHRELFPDHPSNELPSRIDALRRLAAAFNARGEHLASVRNLLRHELAR